MPSRLNITHSKRLYARAVELIPGGSQTMSKRPEGYAPGAFPIYIQRGEGSHVWDVDGNEYIDYINALGPIIFGYRYPATDDAVRRQLDEGVIFGLLHPVEVEAAEAIVASVPCAEMVRFLKSGAEATSAAARIARAYTGRELILNCGYRGWHDQWVIQSQGQAGIPACLKAAIAGFGYNDLDSLESALREHPGQVAAIVIDPVLGVAPDEGFLQGVRRLADEHEAVLIFDEIVSGFRLATGGAQEYYGVTPDLATFAKAMANGLPVAAVCGKREIMQVAKHQVISTTYGGEALSLAALVAAIREYHEKPVHEHLWRQGRTLVNGFHELAQRHGIEACCTGEAPMALPVFSDQQGASAQDVWTFFLQEMAKRGVLVRRGGLLFITYSHSNDDIAHTLSATDETFSLLSKALADGRLKNQLETSDITPSHRTF